MRHEEIATIYTSYSKLFVIGRTNYDQLVFSRWFLLRFGWFLGDSTNNNNYWTLDVWLCGLLDILSSQNKLIALQQSDIQHFRKIKTFRGFRVFISWRYENNYVFEAMENDAIHKKKNRRHFILLQVNAILPNLEPHLLKHVEL